MQNTIDIDSVHPDYDSFQELWRKVIDPEISNFEKEYYGLIKRIPFAKDAIWEQYKKLNDYCKNNYMHNPNGKLDRHKVSACYLLAIAKVAPMRFDTSRFPQSDKYLIINELLAINAGLSLLRGFAIAAILADKKKTDEEKNQQIEQFKLGIKVPDERYVNHGDYIVNYANELHFIIDEGNYSILSIAHELFLLEVLTKLL